MSRRLTAALVVIGFALLLLPWMFRRVGDNAPRHVDVELLDRWTFTTLRQAFPHPDLMNALVLAVGCGVATMAWLIVRRGLVESDRLRRFFGVSAVALAVLAVEETFELTEAAGEAVGVGPKWIDLLIPVAGLVFVIAYRRLLVRSRLAVWLGVAGVAAFAAAFGVEVVPIDHDLPLEDPLESVASLLFVTAFAALTLDLLAEERADRHPSPEVTA